MNDINMNDMIDDNMIGAIKIKDGLFIGDELAAKDLEFIVTNKVTHIINTSGKQIANFWENIGIAYLTLFWVENDNQVLFDPRNETVNEILDFVNEAHEQGESVLVHSVRGQSRACCVLASFFMMKYKWTLYKTLEFLNSRRPDLEIRASFFHQLTQLEQKLQKMGIGASYSQWDPKLNTNDGEDLVLTNTFLNAKSAPFPDYLINIQGKVSPIKKKKTKLQWVDEQQGKNQKLGQVLVPRKQSNTGTLKKRSLSVKSIVKGSNVQFNILTGEKINQENLIKQQQQQQIKENISAANQLDAINNRNKLGNLLGHNQLNDLPTNQKNKRLNYSQDFDYQNQFQQQKNPTNKTNRPNSSHVDPNKPVNQFQIRPSSSSNENKRMAVEEYKDPKNSKDIVPEKQRPASGGAMRHFSPAQKGKSKINKNLPYSTYSVGKNNKAGLRYPSPQINSSGNHNSMYSQSYKWK
ncbi:hypothetical protein PPERSA_11654 [Pseudocohnilembus persalinus]|uniref:Tyrosine-protein phosphatase domain-containing protein n=1 Tax=Pseudocohnilembus persalinus TaxID=266149 RepID=A0A0V0Q9Z0_PSEPJ|nr:hypothetical protein PPERSA_11654 [Pseudocohnilembus persalinus]|eukprot:KRW99053.1 hypothetical protein PPERSA_11654 [Pseudocohnilembus persalinus]